MGVGNCPYEHGYYDIAEGEWVEITETQKTYEPEWILTKNGWIKSK